MSVRLTDNTGRVIASIRSELRAWLHEWSNEIASTAARNCRMTGDNGQLKGSYRAIIGDKHAEVGSDLESAYWEEYGTGEYAVGGNGKKGWWVYVEGMNNHAAKSRTESDAKGIAADMQSQGYCAHATNGRPAKRTLQNAFESVIPQAREDLAERMSRL